ncbi:MAG: hypothetical protein PHY18_01260 [Dehalococcoidales bacterium]|nr:hypothetical protein [Dehalococcoidales bacterium]
MSRITVAVYSPEPIAEMVRNSLNGIETNIVSIPPGVFARRDFSSLDRMLDADLIIMAAAAPDADRVCKHLKGFWHVPLIILFDENTVDWQQLCWSGASAYIPLSSGKREFDSRINIVVKNMMTRLLVPSREEAPL